jgi:hypothetical protein
MGIKKYYLNTLSKQLSTQNKPLLFWDTCALLDFQRLPERQNSIGHYNNYVQIFNMISNGDLLSVTSNLVFIEYQEHFQKTFDSCSSVVRKTNDMIQYYAQFDNNDFSNTNLILQIPNKLQGLLDKIWNDTYVIKEEKAFAKFAHYRTIHKIAPAQKKGEYKDCYIWCACLKLSELLKNETILFFTTNAVDYFPDNNNSNLQIGTDCTTHSNVKLIRNCGEIIGWFNEQNQLSPNNKTEYK